MEQKKNLESWTPPLCIMNQLPEMRLYAAGAVSENGGAMAPVIRLVGLLFD